MTKYYCLVIYGGNGGESWEALKATTDQDAVLEAANLGGTAWEHQPQMYAENGKIVVASLERGQLRDLSAWEVE